MSGNKGRRFFGESLKVNVHVNDAVEGEGVIKVFGLFRSIRISDAELVSTVMMAEGDRYL